MEALLSGSCVAIASVPQLVLVSNEAKPLGRSLPGKEERDDSLLCDSKKMMGQNGLLLGAWNAPTNPT
jgi:hypothetical protein